MTPNKTPYCVIVYIEEETKFGPNLVKGSTQRLAVYETEKQADDYISRLEQVKRYPHLKEVQP